MLQLLLLQMQVDLTIPLLLIFDLELLLFGKLVKYFSQRYRKLLGEKLADSSKRLTRFPSKNVLDGLLITFFEELLDLLSQLSRHCSK